jgi:hypothetical protein
LVLARLGFISFGGPAGQIAIMHEDLVEGRRWISEGRFLHALNFCMVLPGPPRARRGRRAVRDQARGDRDRRARTMHPTASIPTKRIPTL